MFLQIIYPFFHNKIISYNLFFSLKILFLVHDNIALFYLKFFQFLITLILTVFSFFWPLVCSPCLRVGMTSDRNFYFFLIPSERLKTSLSNLFHLIHKCACAKEGRSLLYKNKDKLNFWMGVIQFLNKGQSQWFNFDRVWQ